MTALTRGIPTGVQPRVSTLREDFLTWPKRGFAAKPGARDGDPRAPGSSRPGRTPTAPQAEI